MAEEIVEVSDQVEKKSNFSRILILGINILLFLGGASFFVMTKFGILTSDSSNKTQMIAQGKVQDSIKENSVLDSQALNSINENKNEPKEIILFAMKPIVINLKGHRGRQYLSVTMQVEMTEENEREKIQKYLPVIRNRLILLLSEKTYEEVSSVDGKYILQEEISQIYNEILNTNMVRQIFFVNFILQ